ncbi:hypothetical protein [Pedobacter sp.]|uniref:hypothetical protein n=1 Tax=Pedobacter sp. TaxID=1411316 RepID=UPI003C385052
MDREILKYLQIEDIPIKSKPNVDLLEKILLMQKQINDLHTIVMSSTRSTRKEPKTKKPTKSEKLALILAKRVFDNSTKSS